ncbi:tetratricopeptide repeat protein [Brevundimonas sp. R86498]|uniref:tetratricopeptide repeat protein n=1 Tax=Brevundimonas sp. R86498 TaxID=3093845 RepID=UPI0037CBD8BD
MSRTRASSSIALAASLLCGLALTSPAAAQQAGASRTPASAEDRAAYSRLDPLARSVFWSREMEMNPADPVAGVRLAEALRQMGQYEQAAQTAQQVLVAQPANVDAMLEVGRAHIARGQAFYGIAALEQALALAPDDWRPLSLLGVAYQQVRRAEDAQVAWARALTLSPENPEVLNNAAMARVTGGDAGGAEALLRRALVQPGATQQMRLNLAMVLGLQGRTPEAEQIIRRELPPEVADRNLEWLRNRARAQTTEGRAEASSASARTWSSLQAQ